MIYIILGAALFIAAAFATGEIVFRRRQVANLRRDHQRDLNTMMKMNQKYESMKEARDDYKSECAALDKVNKSLIAKYEPQQAQ